MKTVTLEEMQSRLWRDRGRAVISVADFEFLVELEPEIFKEVCKAPIHEFSFTADEVSKEIGRVGYFVVPDATPNDLVMRLARHPSVRLFVCSPCDGFFDGVPSLVKQAICARNELTDVELSTVASMSGFAWLALRDGDEGDAFYYMFEPR